MRPVEIISRRGAAPILRIVGGMLNKRSHALRFGDCERLPKESVGDAEHRGVYADSERKRYGGGERSARALADHANGKTQVFEEGHTGYTRVATGRFGRMCRESEWRLRR